MDSDTEELIRHSLIEDGYLLFMVGRDTTDFFKDTEAERTVELDYNHRYKLRLNIKENNLEKRIYHHYASKAARFSLSSLFASGYHELWKKPIKIEDFIKYTSEAFKDYCSMKGMDENLARKFKRLSVKEAEVERFLGKGWVKELYEVKDNKIKLKCNLKIIPPKI